LQKNVPPQDAYRDPGPPEGFVSTRVRDAPPDTFDPNELRVGRRENEPHSSEVSYLFDVLRTNFPKDRVIWDLHHYFTLDGKEIDIQFDISYFRDFRVDFTLSSYKASRFNGRVPTMAINILSKSTWHADVGEHVDYCRMLKIPLYVLFCPYHVASSVYEPPFLRAYVLTSDGNYKIQELRALTFDVNDDLNPENVVDVSGIVPFKIGLMRLSLKHEGDLPLFRMVLLEPDSQKRLMTKYEIEKKRADEEKRRADEEKKRADEEKRRADEEKKRADEEKKRADEEKKRADELKARLRKYEEKFGTL